MALAKRVFLFLAVNLLVIVTISIVLQVLGIRPYLTEAGIDYEQLLGFCLIWGMGGAFISLSLSRMMAKFMMGVKVIDPRTTDLNARTLVDRVHQIAKKAGLSKMPEVGVYESPEPNAFATGPSKSRSLVAVSTGLLHSMNHDEVEGVLAHEVAHIANGDMVTMTLIQGIVNAFVMFFARALAFAVSQALRDREGRGGLGGFAHMGLVIVFEILFMILGSIVIAWFSRLREFRADAGGARFAGRERMVAALEALKKRVEIVDPRQPQAFQAMKISNPGKWMMLFSSHPPLDMRIARLKSMRS